MDALAEPAHVAGAAAVGTDVFNAQRPFLLLDQYTKTSILRVCGSISCFRI